MLIDGENITAFNRESGAKPKLRCIHKLRYSKKVNVVRMSTIPSDTAESSNRKQPVHYLKPTRDSDLKSCVSYLLTLYTYVSIRLPVTYAGSAGCVHVLLTVVFIDNKQR